MTKAGRDLKNKSVWHTILRSTCFREVDTRHNAVFVKLRALASIFYDDFALEGFVGECGYQRRP